MREITHKRVCCRAGERVADLNGGSVYVDRVASGKVWFVLEKKADPKIPLQSPDPKD